MNFKKIIVHYWGDIFFLLLHPLLRLVWSRTSAWRFVDDRLAGFLLTAYMIYTVFAIVWAAVFWKKRSRALRDLQYPLYGFFSALCMLIYFLDVFPYVFFRLAADAFFGLAVVRILLWVNERRKKKADKGDAPIREETTCPTH